MINDEDLKTHAFFNQRRRQDVATQTECFVKIEHIPSGISVTKHSGRSQIRARDEAMEELKMLVEIWTAP